MKLIRKRIYGFINKHDRLRKILILLQITFTERKYAVKASGHGSKYRFDGPSPDKPPFPLLHLKDAIFDCRFWEGYADTIGGSAVIINVKSGATIRWDDHLKYDWIKKREIFDPENRLPSFWKYDRLNSEEIKQAEADFKNLTWVFDSDKEYEKRMGKQKFLYSQTIIN